MKTLLITVILVLSINTALSKLEGQAKIDSLLKELPKMKEDTNGVNLLSTLSYELYSINPDKGIEYGLLGVKLSKKINWKKGEATCYYTIGVDYSFGKFDYPIALKYYHKALKINKKIGNKSRISNIILNIGRIYENQSNFPKALSYYKQSLKIDEELGNKSGIAINLGYIGWIYNNQSNYPKALEYYHKALKINEELGNKNGIVANLGYIGIIYKSQSNYPKALEYYHKALKINEELGNKNGIAYNYIYIGNIYLSQSDFPKALEYYHKALKINEEIGDKSGIAYNLINIGLTYFYQSDFKIALEYYHNSMKIMEELGNKTGIAYILGNIGLIYNNQSNYPKALEYYQKALKIDEELGNKNGVARLLGNIGILYLNLSQDSVMSNISEATELVSLNKEVNLNRSIDYLLQSIRLFEEIGELHTRSINYNNLANAYTEKGDYKNALEVYKESKILNDSIFSSENQTKIANLEAKRENELKEKEIVILKKDKENQKLQRYAMFGGIAGLGIIIGLILIQRRKSEKLLLNVLPSTIAKRLKAKEHPIADHFDGASIIFIDLVGFTKMSSSANPKEIVALLNDIFTLFDKLADKHGLEKIKTIGDAYMAVAGIPEIQADHSKRTAQMALDINKEMNDFKTSDGTEIKFRIGIDCGAVVAGVIGEKKFIYDLWSDAVNTASRMESTGESGQIQITDNFKTELEKFDGDWNFTLRGEFEIKGKGLMKTYYLGN